MYKPINKCESLLLSCILWFYIIIYFVFVLRKFQKVWTNLNSLPEGSNKVLGEALSGIIFIN